MNIFNFYCNNAVVTLLSLWMFFFFDVMSSFSLFLTWCGFFLGVVSLQSFIMIRRHWLKGVGYGLIAISVAVYFIRSPSISGYQTIMVEGYSSCPLICDGDIAVVRTRNISYHRGAMVLIQMSESMTPYSKRIHGMPGDSVYVCDSHVYVNGYNYSHQGKWVERELSGGSCSFRDEQFTLEHGEYFVLGDAAEVSVDSRHFGSIHSSQIIGNVIYKGSPETGLQSISVDALFLQPSQISD